MGGGGSQLGPDATGYDLYRQFIVNMHTFANVCGQLQFPCVFRLKAVVANIEPSFY